MVRSLLQDRFWAELYIVLARQLAQCLAVVCLCWFYIQYNTQKCKRNFGGKVDPPYRKRSGLVSAEKYDCVGVTLPRFLTFLGLFARPEAAASQPEDMGAPAKSAAEGVGKAAANILSLGSPRIQFRSGAG